MTRFASALVTVCFLASIGFGQEEKSPPTGYDHLKNAEWMIGTWESSGTEPEGRPGAGKEYIFRASMHWAVKKNALIFDLAYLAPVKRSGKLIVGWDPIAEKIVSFGFGSSGDHGKGVLQIDQDKMHGNHEGNKIDGTPYSYNVELVRKDESTLIRRITKWKEGDKEFPDIEDELRRVPKK